MIATYLAGVIIAMLIFGRLFRENLRGAPQEYIFLGFLALIWPLYFIILPMSLLIILYDRFASDPKGTLR